MSCFLCRLVIKYEGVIMKKLRVYLVGAASAVLLAALVLLIVFFIPRDNTSFSFECFRVKMAVAGFLKDVEKERYADAFDGLYCVSAQSGDALGESESLRNLWVKRLSDLRNGQDATYLDGFSSLKVKKVNGEFRVTVVLKVVRQGYNDPFYANGSEITVVSDDGVWKVLSVSSEDVSLQTPFEKKISGYFSADEWGSSAS